MVYIQEILNNAPREDRLHGNERFPLAPYWLQIGPEELIVELHWHEEAEFFYVLEGAALVQIGTNYYPTQAGEAVFIHGGDIHAAYPLGDAGCSFFAVVFNMNILRSGVKDVVHSDYILPLLEGSRTLPLHYTDHDHTILANLGGIMHILEQKNVGHELAVKAHLYLILADIAAHNSWIIRHAPSPSVTNRIDSLKTVLNYIGTNYMQRITIKEMAALIYMSEGHFCRFFKTMVRQTPIEYINSFRINKATDLIEHTNRKILDIAMEVGFDNLSYFIKKFRVQMNCTPAQYRMRARTDVESS
ncbi:MAG: AraC family transcriptional regulator [Paenibacillaceae bacterium]